ncbi:MAG TPA: YihY/virulence factor BrkB family protein [Candidatus Acidoferrales bacterium]|nr:YihY/virulence factor BrkB family protein [Candidatus Acidoferrales bacterium]
MSLPNVTDAPNASGTFLAEHTKPAHFRVLHEIWAKILKDDCIDMAAEMAYFFVLALFPFFAVLGALAGFLPYTDLWTNVTHQIIEHFPSEARDLALQTLLNLAHRNRTFLSIGFGAMVWTSSSGLVATMENLSRAYNVPETRGFWKKRLIATGMLIVSSAFFFGSFGLLTLGHRMGVFLSSELYFGQTLRIVWEVFRWSFLVILLQTGVAILDNVLPNKRRPWRWLTAGTVFATTMLVGATWGVNFYVRHIGHYSETYGAIGAFFVLMVWIFCSSLVLLIGAEMNSVMERRKVAA